MLVAKLHPAAEEKFALAPADLETRNALLLLIIPPGVLSLVGVAVGVSDPAELPGFLVVLCGIVLMTVLLMAVFFAFTRPGNKDHQASGSPGVCALRASEERCDAAFCRAAFRHRTVGLLPAVGALRLFRPVQGGVPGVDQGLRHVLAERDGCAGDRPGTVLSFSGGTAEVLRCAADPA